MFSSEFFFYTSGYKDFKTYRWLFIKQIYTGKVKLSKLHLGNFIGGQLKRTFDTLKKTKYHQKEVILWRFNGCFIIIMMYITQYCLNCRLLKFSFEASIPILLVMNTIICFSFHNYVKSTRITLTFLH